MWSWLSENGAGWGEGRRGSFSSHLPCHSHSIHWEKRGKKEEIFLPFFYTSPPLLPLFFHSKNMSLPLKGARRKERREGKERRGGARRAFDQAMKERRKERRRRRLLFFLPPFLPLSAFSLLLLRRQRPSHPKATTLLRQVLLRLHHPRLHYT